MDLNASPQPEEDEETFEPHYEEYHAPERHTEHRNLVEHVESAVDIARRSVKRDANDLKRDLPDDRPMTACQPPRGDLMFQTKRHKPSDRNKLPPGWLGCPAVGQEIGCIIPSKLPLGEGFNDSVLPGKRYSSRQVIHQQRVLRRKISCKGRDSVPDNEAVNQFFYEVSQFVIRQKQAKKYILVHCTHGHNHTGFMIVHYLMRTLPISVTQAIKIFADARPLGIYKPDYIDALYNFYHERKPDMVTCPSTPEWKRSFELDLNGDALPDEDDDDGAPASPIQGLVEKTHHFTLLDGEMIIDTLPDPQKQERRYLIYDMMEKNQVSITEGWDDPYVPRTHEGLLKWKYPEMNSVDFLFEMVDGRQLLFLHERGKKKLMDGNKIVFNGGDDDPSSYSGKIVECSWDSEEDVWICMRVRTDKATPNDFNTYRKVVRSIKDNITEEILINEITEILRLPMFADRINSDSKAAQQSNSARRR